MNNVFQRNLEHFNLSSKFDPIFILIFPIFLPSFQSKISSLQELDQSRKNLTEARWIARKPTIYIITKFSLHHFFIIFHSQKWYFIERFINHTYSNLIPRHVLIKDTKQKTHINYSNRHRAKSLRTLKKVLNTSMQFMQKVENFSSFVIHKHTVKHMITLRTPKLL